MKQIPRYSIIVEDKEIYITRSKVVVWESPFIIRKVSTNDRISSVKMLLTKAEELRDFRKSGELSDICVIVNKSEFHLHKFPLFLSSEFFRALCRCGMMDENNVRLQQFPGGEKTFALIADYCYGMDININSKNVVELRCAADFLQMTSLATETTSALNQILQRQPIAVVDILQSACQLGEIASQTNILSQCFNAVFEVMNKGNISERIFEVLLELPTGWFIALIIRARDARIAVPTINRLAGKYIEKTIRKNKVHINEYLQRQNSDNQESPEVVNPDMMSTIEDLGEIVDAILLELPKGTSLSDVLDAELSCLLYRLAVQLGCKCEAMLLAVVGTNLCKVPLEILATMPTSDIVSIVEHNVHNNVVSPAALCKTIDCYLWQRTKQKHITLEDFDAVVRATPTSYRTQHDSILLIAEELFSRTEISEEMKLKTLDLIDTYKLHEDTLRKVSKRNAIPSTFIVSSALAVSSRLRNELIEAKAKLGEKNDDIRKIHASISDVIEGQWEGNDITLNVTPKDEINTRVQFAKVLARNTSCGLTMEHEVYDGKLTLCVKSRATSTHSCETSTKTFLFDPFGEQLVELTRSKHDNLAVGEHYEKKKHTSPYWPFMDVAVEQ